MVVKLKHTKDVFSEYTADDARDDLMDTQIELTRLQMRLEGIRISNLSIDTRIKELLNVYADIKWCFRNIAYLKRRIENKKCYAEKMLKFYGENNT